MLDEDFFQGVACILPNKTTNREQRKVARQVIAAFANQVYQATVAAMQIWSFDAASSNRLSDRFKKHVLSKLESHSFSAAVADLLEAYDRSGIKKQERSQKNNLIQWLDELVELSR
ncbi:MAG TPA: hypothetical protein IAC75_02730 [Candidatus Spyradosoma merdigallinarum]|uniref:Uncharacterized protein n=1 Tax=Candidatus Spyradosoma merdigallinarum TaxID=2840950 RepID=A0A9D1NJ53_9BACT|nr:hypothetical protein [Candidatus Spyradosoma merdigallinarum]